MRAALERFKRTIETAWPGRVLEMRLFGSMARGDAHEGSDLDVFVMVDERDVDLDKSIRDAAYDVTYELDLPHPISPRIMSRDHFQDLLRLERLLARAIVEEGIKL